ncbi:MAG: alkaline phosphatase family protein [Gemmatimonadales bacterium]|nr:alkaline phosphatase family protein [Gemmatimonadales bacterium]
MRSYLAPLVLLLTACAGGSRVDPTPVPAAGGGTVLLISLDGFRWDYLDRAVAPNLQALARGGVRAQWMTPAFPSLTFPNHYTMVTGLYPEHHGIVANTMRDAVLGAFRISDTTAVRDARWWGGEPIWRTAQRQGKHAAAFFWPGSEAPIGGAMPWRSMAFNDTFPNAARVDSVLTWLSRPRGEAPSVVTLYYSDVDHAGHDFGPDAPQTDSAIARVDSMIGRLMAGLAARKLTDRVNVIVVSDHGMIATSAERVIKLDDYISVADIDVVDWSPVGTIIPKPGKEAAVFDALVRAHPRLKVYRKGEVTARLHFNNHARITPLVLVADPGWTIASTARLAARRPNAGGHGFDNAAREMGALFVASGPAFRQGVTVAPFENIHLYSLMAHILGVTPAPNDGSLDSVRTLLRGAPEQGASADRIRGHLITLASDAYEGRQPGTRGDTLATRYVQRAMASAGLSAGSADGTWLQSVSLLGVTPGGTVRRWQDSATRSTFGASDLLLWTRGMDGPRRLDAGDVVFVGHGIVTADGRWDDYKGVDVRGKVVVLLGGVPQAATGVSLVPGEQQRTATARGAWAVATIVNPAQWAQLSPAFRRETVRLAADTTVAGTLEILVHPDAATRFFGDGTALAAARSEAAAASFRPRALPGKVFVDYLPRRRAVVSPNVLGLLAGSDPTLRDEVVVVTAHWDHFGRNPTLTGDQIFNGAFDNAVGTASMLEMARVLAAGPRPKRSVLFVATTAEESGLLGATWYTRQPRFPLAKTVAAVNLDAGNPWGRTRDVIVLGGALSSLDSIFGAVAAAQGRRVTPDPYPEQGFYRRSDHFAFARVGIPAMFTATGMDFVGRPAGWGKAVFDRYLAGTYHSPSDEVGGDWDLRGGAEDVDALAETVRRIANAAGRPTWNNQPETAAFRAAQAAQRKTP